MIEAQGGGSTCKIRQDANCCAGKAAMNYSVQFYVFRVSHADDVPHSEV